MISFKVFVTIISVYLLLKQINVLSLCCIDFKILLHALFPYKLQALLKNTDKFKLLTVMQLQIQTEVSQSHEVR